MCQRYKVYDFVRDFQGINLFGTAKIAIAGAKFLQFTHDIEIKYLFANDIRRKLYPH